MQVKLIAKTRKGKNKLNKSKCDVFDLVGEKEQTVGFTSEKGPWLCLVNPNDKNDIRWVHEFNDMDFTVNKWC